MLPLSAVTESDPWMSWAVTGPPPESRLASVAPEMLIGPPPLCAVTATLRGTVMVKPTEQLALAHEGAARVSSPPETVADTRGGPPGKKYPISSETVTLSPGPCTTSIGAP